MKRLSLACIALLILLSSCQVKSIREGDVPKDRDWWVYVNYFSNKPSKLVFKAGIDVAGEHFSGLLIVKQMAEGDYRCIFTTETGFKIFDYSIKDDGYTVNYAVGAMQKKIIADRMAYTIQAVLLRDFGRDYLVYRGCQSYKRGKYVYELYHNQKEGDKMFENGVVINRQIVYRNGRKKAEAAFVGSGQENQLDSARVTHQGFPLSATFRLLKP